MSLYNFTGNNDGGEPMGDVLLGSDGNIYGTTAGYGQFDYGVVYRLTAPQSGGSWGFSVLHAFQGGSDGEVPRDGLVQDASGTLYGATAGFDNSYGNVFQINTDGSNYNVIYTILGGQGFTGNGPWQTVTLGADGKIYGHDLRRWRKFVRRGLSVDAARRKIVESESAVHVSGWCGGPVFLLKAVDRQGGTSLWHDLWCRRTSWLFSRHGLADKAVISDIVERSGREKFFPALPSCPESYKRLEAKTLRGTSRFKQNGEFR
ncbi:MAG: choice-of-anchor tandem repeat GloVer-containing protein [Rhizomicrobium sp.]